jgi:hypothetical protein
MLLFQVLLALNLAGIVYRLARKQRAAPSPQLTGEFMFIVKADNPDVRYKIVPGVALDSEGNEVPQSDLTIDVKSDDSDVVSATPDPTDQTTGTVHFGRPGNAALTATVSSANGIHEVIGAQFSFDGRRRFVNRRRLDELRGP